MSDSLPVGDLLDSFELHLKAKNRSAKTIFSYRLAVSQLVEHVDDKPVGEITRQDIERFLAHFLATRASATARQRYASLKQFFKWAAAEEEIETNPMERLEPPRVIEQPVEVLTVDMLRALLRTCGNDFDGRRDEAIIRLFADTGIRLGEMAGISLEDVHLDLKVAVVTGKGSKTRTVPYSDKTAQALDRYRRARLRHKDASKTVGWWLGRNGRFTETGISQMLRRRSAAAGLEPIHAHQFRHTFAHTWLSVGGNEGDLQRIAGWSSPQMLRRYGRSAADQRARENYRKLDLWGDL